MIQDALTTCVCVLWTEKNKNKKYSARIKRYFFDLKCVHDVRIHLVSYEKKEGFDIQGSGGTAKLLWESIKVILLPPFMG